MGAKKGEKESVLEEKWLFTLEKIHENSVVLKNAQSLEELARLNSHQQELRYHSGEATLAMFLESRKEVLKAQKESLRRGLEYDRTVLSFRELTGDLGNTYVDANSWQK